jgi:hypothetical protein
LSWSASFAGDGRIRAEIYIDFGEKQQNKAFFERLREKSSVLQKQFAEPLSWERLDDRRACRVAVYREGSIEDSSEELAAARIWLVDRMLAIKRAFEPIAKELLE